MLFDEIKGNGANAEFVTLELRKGAGLGACGALPILSKVRGAVQGKVENATEELNFAAAGGLTVAGEPASYTGTTTQKIESTRNTGLKGV